MNKAKENMTYGDLALNRILAARKLAAARAVLSDRLSRVCHLVNTAISEAEFSDPPDDFRDGLRAAARTLDELSSQARVLARETV